MPPEPASARLLIAVGDDEWAIREAALALVAERRRAWPNAEVVDAPPPEHWPFLYPLASLTTAGPVIVFAERADRAFEHAQARHTRLVTTQAHYLAAEWDAALEAHGRACLVATLLRTATERFAEEVLERRGLFRHAHLVEVSASTTGVTVDETPGTESSLEGYLAVALRAPDATDRLRRVVDALALGRTAPALLVAASACQEVNDLDGAARDLDEAIRLAPSWAAPHFERGKVSLRLDDMEGAAAAFRAATELLPCFGGAWGNLGAALGELDRPDEALAAFERLHALDPDSPQAANNVGVVLRELGRLGESEAAFRRVIALEPNLAFGHYNLGHTLFLQGRYHAAAAAYGRGQERDPGRNPVQASRLALCRLATGDASGALAELRRAAEAVPRSARQQLLADTSAVLWALVTQKPDLTGWRGVHDWVTGELATLAREGGA